MAFVYNVKRQWSFLFVAVVFPQLKAIFQSVKEQIGLKFQK